jgi:hypothetical protein
VAGISRLSLIINEIKAFTCFHANSAQQQCIDLTWKIRVFRLFAALSSVEGVIEICCFSLLTAEIHANSCCYFLQLQKTVYN